MYGNNKIVTFKEQDIYKSNKSFKKAMKSLHEKDIILCRAIRTDNKKDCFNQYKLTIFGEHIAEILKRIQK
jgi:hypothetical protein